MKSRLLKLLPFGIFSLFFITISCSDTDDNLIINSNEQIIIELRNIMQTGSWRITSFIDSGENETDHFDGYNFIFEGTGILRAENFSNNYEGTWRITDDDDSQDDSGSESLDFIINFNLTNDFEDLNEDWDIVSYNAGTIQLRDISGGDGDTDFLTFQRN